ncbi:hypothetical protein KQX54_001120 [Cotesia glomerata]|uniref:Uncharacterized protein n=1 Tax=Cotesia glomerata TaxID=32391 RepID=A0AAV7IHA0_COTGL|nr:hypothetical protein KQX54_001120 [Cotesia glomerata]
MGPKAKVSVEEAVNALKKYIKYFIPPEKPKWSADIWKTLAKELDFKWDHNAVRTHVNNNRRNILTVALQECGYFTEEVKVESNIDNGENENIDYSDGSNSEDEDNINDPDYCAHSAYFNDLDEIDEFDVEICRDLIIDNDGETITAASAKLELENLIASRNTEKFLSNVTAEIENLDLDSKKNIFPNTPADGKDSLSISTWMTKILKTSKNVIHQGEKLHGFFLPTLEKLLIEAAVL